MSVFGGLDALVIPYISITRYGTAVGFEAHDVDRCETFVQCFGGVEDIDINGSCSGGAAL